MKNSVDAVVLGENYVNQQKDILKYLSQFDFVKTEYQITEDLDMDINLVKNHLDDMRHQGLTCVCGTWHWKLTYLGKEYVEKKL